MSGYNGNGDTISITTNSVTPIAHSLVLEQFLRTSSESALLSETVPGVKIVNTKKQTLSSQVDCSKEARTERKSATCAIHNENDDDLKDGPIKRKPRNIRKATNASQSDIKSINSKIMFFHLCHLHNWNRTDDSVFYFQGKETLFHKYFQDVADEMDDEQTKEPIQQTSSKRQQKRKSRDQNVIDVFCYAKIQKQQQRATMTYNPDINNSVNLRRNIMRVMNEAERNVRTWSNYVIEDRANMTKSLDCRAKTANTSKTKMFSAIMVINNLEEQFKADNKLIRRLTNNGIIDDKYFLREMAKNDVQEHLLEDTIRETRRYAEATIAEMISIEREILQGRVSNHLEFVDILRSRMMAREMNQMREAFLTGAGASIDDRRDDDERRSRVDTSSDDQSSRRSTSTRRSRSLSTQRSATPQ
ncbi:Protein CBG26673 [Caenorhabditis briggsae]|uniref:Protein CBG26673 n=1 Tax=Caenorhabditis briggsae TaxID=6238 RepID=B6IE38_CAEBR|nr:Protein CBG26673 [Caenorhabditis briggsae]CAS01102.1 Protein CBG26673 [Caenorhabditis briggsae]